MTFLRQEDESSGNFDDIHILAERTVIGTLESKNAVNRISLLMIKKTLLYFNNSKQRIYTTIR